MKHKDLVPIKLLNDLPFTPKERIKKHINLNEDNLPNELIYFAKEQTEKFFFENKDIELVTELILYFNGCKESVFDLNKGICLSGDNGLGKSFLMNAIRKYLSNRQNPNVFRIASVEKLMESIKDKSINKYLFYERAKEIKQVNLCVNEFGKELESKLLYFGSPMKEHIEQFLKLKYEDFVPKLSITHATTNIRKENLLDLYGKTLSDRYIEMFNWVEITGKTRRK